MEFFITEWRWGQKVRRKISEGTLSSAHQKEAAVHQKTGSSSAKPQLSCLWQQHRYCGFYAENSVQLFFCFFQASKDFQSGALMSFCPFSMSEYLVFLSCVTFLGPFSWKSADSWKRLEDSKVEALWRSSLSHTQMGFISVIPFECKNKYESLKRKRKKKKSDITEKNRVMMDLWRSKMQNPRILI